MPKRSHTRMAKPISDLPRVVPAPATPANLFTARRNVFIWLALFLVVLTILRSAISTSKDGFTIDEAYHIAAGVSYVKYHDFRINPEHPPLVKLWVGMSCIQQDFGWICFADSMTNRENGILQILPFFARTTLIPSSDARCESHSENPSAEIAETAA